jgi:LasA protease
LRQITVLLRGLLPLLLLVAAAACVREQPQVIVITATFLPGDAPPVIVAPNPTALPESQVLPLSPVPDVPGISPTLDPIQQAGSTSLATEHVVAAGETLSIIAAKYNVTIEMLMAANAITNPDILSIGQILQLPDVPVQQSPAFKMIPDSRVVRAPGSRNFDTAGFIALQPGYIRQAADMVTTRTANGTGIDTLLTAAQVIDRVAMEYSVDPRLLLVLLEFRAGWLSNAQPLEALLTHPLVSRENSADFDRTGLYKQLSWAANEINRGYYGWKTRGLDVLSLPDGTRLMFAPGLNAGTIGMQYFLALYSATSAWQYAVSADGFYHVYYSYFGDPFQNAVEPLVPVALEQPPLTLPFASGEVWYYTGGPHGGWGAGSAWSSVDFAPPDNIETVTSSCYTSEYLVRAVAPGLIARSGDGTVILDLDGDGDETTGWTILYLHLDNLIPPNVRVNAGDVVGQAACAGGFSSATHMHIARRFNGEWLPADCQQCLPGHERPPFVMSGWQVIGIPNQEYQGYMQQGSTYLTAEQGRTSPVNYVSW